MGGKGKRDKEKRQAVDAAAAGRTRGSGPNLANVASFEDSVVKRLFDFDQVHNHQGIIDLKADAIEVATAWQTTQPMNSVMIYMWEAQSHTKLGKTLDAIEMYELCRVVLDQVHVHLSY
jgi:hypothetical protein